MLAGLWVSSATGVVAQVDCNSGYTGSALAPDKPELAMAFRESLVLTPEAPKNIRLRWVNKSSNFGCTGVETNYSSQGRAALGGTWDALETIVDPAVSEYLHAAVPTRGEICYRVYAANSLGRSEYSNRVCLVLGVAVTPSPDTDVTGGNSTEDDSGMPVWIIAGIAVAAVVVVGGGVAMLRGRAGRS